jgi:hypothetical protein
LQALVETERAAAGQEHYHTAQACHDTASMSHFFRLVSVSFFSLSRFTVAKRSSGYGIELLSYFLFYG